MPVPPTDDPAEPLRLKMPALSDEITVTLYELLQRFLEQYENYYEYQIHRVYYERACEQRALRKRHLVQSSQQSLPLYDDRTPF